MIVAMGLQMLMKAPIMAVWAVIKILGKSWTLSAVTAGFVVALGHAGAAHHDRAACHGSAGCRRRRTRSTASPGKI